MQENFVINVLPATGSQEVGGLWSNPSRITADDGSEAAFWEGAGANSKKLQASDFPIPTLPPGAVVDGIALNIKQTTTSIPPEITVQPVELNIAGSSSKAIVFNGITGGASDLWGLSEITQSDLDNLVVSISATSIGGVGGSLYIDCVYLIVYWHLEITGAPADVPTRVDYKVYSNDGVYLGNLPNVTSKLGFSQDMNSAGASIDIVCGTKPENTTTVDTLLTDADAEILTDDDLPILTSSTNTIIASGESNKTALFKNGNRIIVVLYNYWYPNGKQIFKGQVNRISLSSGGDNSIKLLVYSDGLDLDNYLLQPISSFSYTNDVSQTTNNANITVSATIMGGGSKGGGPTSWESWGQTFKTGSIARIGAIILYGSGSANLKVSLYSTVNGTLLGTATATPDAVSGQIAFYFTTPINVTANATYFMTVKVDTDGMVNNTTSSATLRRNTTSVYADGAAYRSTSSSPAWSSSVGGDLYFITQSATLGNTTVTYTNKDPVSEMVAEALSDYNTRGGLITARDLTATGLSLTYSFNSSTIFEVIKKALESSPVGFYSYVDLGTAEIDIAQVSPTADYIVTKGKNVNQLDLVMTIENISNNLLYSGGPVGGGDNLLRTYNDPVSTSKYGLRTAAKSDNRVTLDATADAIGETYIAENAEEQQETSVIVLNSQMDITQLTPGKTIGFSNFGDLIDSMVLQISRRDYRPDAVVLTLGRLPVRMNDVIANINLALKYQETANNPTSPS